MTDRLPEYPLIRASDATSWVLCARRAWLDRTFEQEEDIETDQFEQLVIDMGLAHEANTLERLKEQFTVHTAKSVEHTQQLMTEGVDVIYQAQLLNDQEGFIGYPDFLIRDASGSYQPADAKLSQNEAKKEIQAQLGLYRRMLGNGLPARVFLGDGSEATIGDDTNPITNQFVTEMRELLSNEEEPVVRYSHSKCRACLYFEHCKPAFEAKEELSLIYGIQGRAAQGLEKEGIDTITKLTESDATSIPDVPYLKGYEKKHRAILQAKSYRTGEVFKTNDISLPEGNWVHFDIEDNPLTPSGEKHVYLWGFLVPGYTNDDFEYVWTDTEDEDQQGWIMLLNKVEEYRNNYPDLILAHYSSHERTTIKKYAERYSMEDNKTVTYLLGNDSPLFDMQKPVLESLVLPLQGYGLKDICKHKDLVNFQWEDDDSGSQWSIVQFNHFLEETNPENREQLKTDILGYNRDDVIATRKLEEWLRTNFVS
ncbi:MAG: TM0106 family RecB-like putative nuclease [Candidatus Thiodiazotropha sp. (ex Troendleina suluensis)]|nr:TM0106 family RecB-like putative nuclease [Candidatus Thiodiazotropha sp. (ex Troendleina suluensis)]